MERSRHSSSHSGKKRSKKQKQPAADRDTVLQIINQLRATFNLPEIKTQGPIDEYASDILTNPNAYFEAQDLVLLSDYHFCELFDGKSSSQQLVQKWLNDSGRRPVIFAPGKMGTVVFIDTEEGTYISVVVLSLFH